MDWDGYPAALELGDQVDDLIDLSLFLADTPRNDFVQAVLVLCQDWQADPGVLDSLARAFPREVLAYRTWVAYPPPMTAAELLGALLVIPDVPDAPPAQLLPVQLDRLQVLGLGNAQASVTIKHRLDTGQPWRLQQFLVPTPTIEVDPRLLAAPDGATLLVRLTVQDQP